MEDKKPISNRSGFVTRLLTLLILVIMVVVLIPLNSGVMVRYQQGVDELLSVVDRIQDMKRITADVVNKAELLAYVGKDPMTDQYIKEIERDLISIKIFNEEYKEKLAYFAKEESDERLGLSIVSVTNRIENIVSTIPVENSKAASFVGDLEEEYDELRSKLDHVEDVERAILSEHMEVSGSKVTRVLDGVTIVIVLLFCMQLHVLLAGMFEGVKKLKNY